MRRKYWNKAVIAHEIKRLYEMGKDLSWTGMRSEQSHLLAAACRYFGGWQEAVEFAGIDYGRIRRVEAWSVERITRNIRDLHDQGVDLSLRCMCENSEYARVVYAAGRHFISWREAIESAGLNYDDIVRQKTWSRQDIEGTILLLHQQGEDLSSRNMDIKHQALISAARKRFGSWERAVSSVGLDYDAIRKREAWSRDILSARIRQLSLEGESLRSTSILRRDPALYAATQKKRYFGGWIEALQAAGVDHGSTRSRRKSGVPPESRGASSSTPPAELTESVGTQVEY